MDEARSASRWLERCGRFSPIVGFESFDHESILLDVTGLAHLFGGEAASLEGVVGDFCRAGASAHIALADTIGAAWAVARYGQQQIANCKFSIGNFPLSSLTIVPPGDARAFLAPLPVEALRLPEETVRLLHALGITRVEQVEALPRAELLSRFSDVLRTRLDQAFGRVDEPVLACSLPPTFVADWSPEHPVARRETIEAALEHLVRRVATMLASCGRGALRLECRLESSRHAPRVCYLSIGLFEPTAAADHLFELVRLRLEQFRISAAITDIRVEATLTAPLEPKQAMLFDLTDDGRRNPRQVASLVERLSSRLGSKAVVGVRLRPEAQPEFSWHYDPLVERRRGKLKGREGGSPIFAEVKTPLGATAGLSSSAGNTARQAKRDARHFKSVDTPGTAPLRLLLRPLPLVATSIVPGGPPLGFHFAGQQHRIVKTWGPERIETGWWRGRPVGRDYFRVETTAGHRFWLFRRLRDEKWFLHGMFE